MYVQVALKVDFVLSSPRMRALKASKEEVLEALSSSTEIGIKTDEKGDTWLLRGAPLPPLRRREKKADKRKEDSGAVGRDPHAAG